MSYYFFFVFVQIILTKIILATTPTITQYSKRDNPYADNNVLKSGVINCEEKNTLQATSKRGCCWWCCCRATNTTNNKSTYTKEEVSTLDLNHILLYQKLKRLTDEQAGAYINLNIMNCEEQAVLDICKKMKKCKNIDSLKSRINEEISSCKETRLQLQYSKSIEFFVNSSLHIKIDPILFYHQLEGLTEEQAGECIKLYIMNCEERATLSFYKEMKGCSSLKSLNIRINKELNSYKATRLQQQYELIELFVNSSLHEESYNEEKFMEIESTKAKTHTNQYENEQKDSTCEIHTLGLSLEESCDSSNKLEMSLSIEKQEENASYINNFFGEIVSYKV